ncbi:MAG: PBECR2 nuclease fold domain-containing protein [Peptoniphilaceae bacterium]|nr:PBECR2 nuclease fold domain-containing protein [Peptoniphilaceae bacterium]
MIEDIKKILNIETDVNRLVISNGLKKHLIKHNHRNVLKYYDNIENIINNPDYIGKNPNEKEVSFECVKILDDNLLVAVKLDKKRSYFYVASFYEITESKLKSMLKSGRLKKFVLTKGELEDII